MKKPLIYLLVLGLVVFGGLALPGPAALAEDDVPVRLEVEGCMGLSVTEESLSLNASPTGTSYECIPENDSFQVLVWSNCDWWMRVEWSGFVGQDDGVEYTLPADMMRVYRKIGPPPTPPWEEITNPWMSEIKSPCGWERKEHFRCEIRLPSWTDHAGRYGGQITVSIYCQP